MRSACVLGMLLPALLLAGASAAAAETLHRATAAGQPVMIRRHVNFLSGCAGVIPTITFTTPPAHGAVEVRPDHFFFPKGFAGSPFKDCEGREVDGGAIWYTPAAGFHGVDNFTWTVDFGRGGKNHRMDTHSAEVTVQ